MAIPGVSGYHQDGVTVRGPKFAEENTLPDTDSAEIIFDLDEKLYPVEAAQSAAYMFTDRAYVRVEAPAGGRLRVVMSPKEDAGEKARVAIRGEFDNELLHQVLRQRVSASNHKIREYIVTKALVSSQPSALVEASSPQAAAADSPCAQCVPAGAPPAAPAVDEALEKEIDKLLAEIEGGGAGADPLGVSVPWEEKYGAAAKTPAAPVKAKPAGKARAARKGKKS